MEAKFLNSEIAKAEEAVEQSASLAEALNTIATHELRILAMVDIVCELAIENAKLRVELQMMRVDDGNIQR